MWQRLKNYFKTKWMQGCDLSHNFFSTKVFCMRVPERKNRTAKLKKRLDNNVANCYYSFLQNKLWLLYHVFVIIIILIFSWSQSVFDGFFNAFCKYECQKNWCQNMQRTTPNWHFSLSITPFQTIFQFFEVQDVNQLIVNQVKCQWNST